MAAREMPTPPKATGTAAMDAAGDGSADPFAPACIPRFAGERNAQKGSTPEKDTDTAVGVARTARVVDLIVPTRQNQSARNVTARRSNLIVQIHRKMNPRMNPRVNPRMNPRVNPMNPRMNPRRRPLRTMRATRTMRTLRAVHCSESHQE